MIKQLFFTAALLAPGLAHAGNPSTNLPGQIVPASDTACDQGPDYVGSVPGPAAAAGFTHCALNADFTWTTTDSNGINYSNIATWIAECGAPTRQYNFHLAYFFNVLTPSPCDDVDIQADPLGGGFNVLHLQFSLEDQQLFINSPDHGSPTYSYDSLTMTWPSLSQGTPSLPYEMYIETTFYLPVSMLNSGVPDHASFSAMNSTTVATDVPSTHLAVTQFEIVGAPANSGATSWLWSSGLGIYPRGSTPPAVQDYFDFASGYNTIGQLITSDETSKISICSFINGNHQGCINADISTSGALACAGGGYACYFGQNGVILMEYLGFMTCISDLSPYNRPCIQNNLDHYYKSIRVWTCANYKTTQCPGPIITSDTAPLRR